MIYTVVGIHQEGSHRHAESVEADNPREAQVKVCKSMKRHGERGFLVAGVFEGEVKPVDAEDNGRFPFFSASEEPGPEQPMDDNHPGCIGMANDTLPLEAAAH